jgi:hypothetical protein
VSLHHGHSLALAAPAPARLSELAQIPPDMLAPAPSATSDASSAAGAAGSAKTSAESPAGVQGWLGHYARAEQPAAAQGAGAAEGAAARLRRELDAKMRAAAAAARLLRKAEADPQAGSTSKAAVVAAAELLAQRTERLRMEAHSVASQEEDQRAELGDLWDQGDATL